MLFKKSGPVEVLGGNPKSKTKLGHHDFNVLEKEKLSEKIDQLKEISNPEKKKIRSLANKNLFTAIYFWPICLLTLYLNFTILLFRQRFSANGTGFIIFR